MNRWVALTVVMSLGTSTLTFAGEGLMQSASRITRQQAVEQARSTSSAARAGTAKSPIVLMPSFAAQQAGQPVLSKSNMRTRTKVLIFLAAGIGVAAGAWAIDHKVLDVTPSSEGTRRDGCKPFCGSPSQ